MDEAKTGIDPAPFVPIEYRGQVQSVPWATTLVDLKRLLREKVIPAVRGARAFDPRIELAVTEYVFTIDESLEGTKKAMERIGIVDENEAEDLARISRREGFNPVLSDRLSWRKEFDGDVRVGDKYLPFAVRRYVIGPMVVDESVFEIEGGPSFEEDVEACTFFPKFAVVVDGNVLLEALEGEKTVEVNNKDLVEIIDSLTVNK